MGCTAGELYWLICVEFVVSLFIYYAYTCTCGYSSMLARTHAQCLACIFSLSLSLPSLPVFGDENII